MDAFIESVRAQPCLWNPLHPDYREMHAKDEAWQCVVDQNNDVCIPNIQLAKAEWKKLRDSHRHALKRAKLGKNKLLPAQITTWKYAKHMQFLEPHMKYRITEHIEMEPISESGSKRQREASVLALAAEPGPPGPPAKRRALDRPADTDAATTARKDPDALEASVLALAAEPGPPGPPAKRRALDRPADTDAATTARKDPDALESFFNCVLKSTREMPPWMQTEVKKNIFAVIIDAEERLSNRENDTPDQSCEELQIKIKCEAIIDDY